MSATEVALLASIAPAFAGMAQRAVALARAQKWMAVVARVLDAPRAAAGGSRPPPLRPDAIALDGVSFRYPAAPNEALLDVSFRWTGGVLGLTGANGSGKSTCLRLLLGLAFPDRGAVTVDGVALSALDLEAWRGGIAFLPQRPYFPPRADVREAIRFLVPGAADEAMREALQRSGAWSLLDARGGDPLGVRLDALSVGGRQRVGLARLLCTKAPLVLLDEPDANLDRAGIALVARLVRELSAEARVAIVAHSPELLEVVDRTLVLDRGRIVEDRGGPSPGGG
jgi:ATP-binding cassette subfamily C protein CydCD